VPIADGYNFRSEFQVLLLRRSAISVRDKTHAHQSQRTQADGTPDLFDTLNGSVVIVVHIELFAANITTMLSDYFPILKTNTSERAPPNTNKLHDRIFGTTT